LRHDLQQALEGGAFAQKVIGASEGLVAHRGHGVVGRSALEGIADRSTVADLPTTGHPKLMGRRQA